MEKGGWGFLAIGIGFFLLAAWAMISNNSLTIKNSGNIKLDSHTLDWKLEKQIIIKKPDPWPTLPAQKSASVDY